MSDKEEIAGQITAAKEQLAETITAMQGVLSTIADTQTTVTGVMGEPDENFSAAESLIEGAVSAAEGISSQLDEAVASVNAAGS